MSHLLNVSAVRAYALEQAGKRRPTVGFRRVGQSFLDEIEAAVRETVRDKIDRLPSRGKTIQGEHYAGNGKKGTEQ